eukprot:2776454-Rhodomonas_salina.3
MQFVPVMWFLFLFFFSAFARSLCRPAKSKPRRREISAPIAPEMRHRECVEKQRRGDTQRVVAGEPTLSEGKPRFSKSRSASIHARAAPACGDKAAVHGDNATVYGRNATVCGHNAGLCGERPACIASSLNLACADGGISSVFDDTASIYGVRLHPFVV